MITLRFSEKDAKLLLEFITFFHDKELQVYNKIKDEEPPENLKEHAETILKQYTHDIKKLDDFRNKISKAITKPKK